MKTACIYHRIDLDGWMSAAIVKRAFEVMEALKEVANKSPLESQGKFEKNTLELIGYNYGDPIPDLDSYGVVIMVDISLPVEIMKSLATRLGETFIWLDHHISAIKDNYEMLENSEFVYYGTRDPKFAACELTWRYFFPNDKMPEIVRLLGRYDCFGHKQVWKPVKEYEGIYEISNEGNVRSLNRIITEEGTDTKRLVEGKDLSPAISKRGYLVVVLCKEGTEKMYTVHQLVATNFIPNPENKPTVNHKDSNRLNCHVTNLEWATYLENNLHSIQNGNRGKSVLQLDNDGNVVNEFGSIEAAQVFTNIAAQNIGKVCRGERERAGDFLWEYGLDKEQIPQFIPKSEELKVLEFQYAARVVIDGPEMAYQALIETSEEQIESYLRAGNFIYKHLCTEAKQAYKNGFEVMFHREHEEGKEHLPCIFKFFMVNKERFNPINFGIDYHTDGYDGAGCFHFNGKKWSFSLYNDNGLVDCSSICKQFGGGGHKGAAGFIIDNINEIIK